MMSPKKWFTAGLFAFGLGVASTASAQWAPFSDCNCGQAQMQQPFMQQPMMMQGNPCEICPQQVFAPQPIIAPMQQPVYQTYMQPQLRTQLRQKQIIRYKQVPRIQHQRHSYIENVPMTSYQTVQVDEGGYQQVWVPKMVQKQVPQTVYVPQTRYRDVAMQTMEQVPYAEMTYIPEQSVTYVPQTRAIGMQTVGSQIVGWQQGPGQVAGWGYPPAATTAWQSPYGYPMTAGIDAPMLAFPGEPYLPQQSAGVNVPTPDPSYLQVPTTSNGSAEWSTIKSRSAAAEDYNPQPTRTSQVPSAAIVR